MDLVPAIFYVIVFIVVIVPVLISDGSKRRMMLGNFEKYRELIRVNKVTSIKKIAAITGIPVEQVKKEIQNMIKTKYLLNAHINFTKNIIILEDEVSPAGNITAAEPNSNMQTIICKSCGAANPKSNKACEYCDSPLFDANTLNI